MRVKTVTFAMPTIGSTLLSLFILSSSSVAAQTQNTEPREEIEVLVVTAQKKKEISADVPIAISAFSGSDLEERVVDDAYDLQYDVPNLVYNGAISTLRGVGNNAISSTSESGLGFHVNGVYLNNPSDRAQEYFDLERIEVLRGPQGTLYGRNTTAGVINLITHKPDDFFNADIGLTFGEDGYQRVKASLNLPVSKTIMQRFAGYITQRDGYTKNQFNDSDIDGRDSFALRSSTRFQPSESTTADLVISYFEEDSNRSQVSKTVCVKSRLFGCSADVQADAFDTPDSRATLFQILPTTPFLYPDPGADVNLTASNPADFRLVNYDIDPIYQEDELIISFELNHDFGDWTLTSITGYQETSSLTVDDFDKVAPTTQLNIPVSFRADGISTITTRSIQSARRIQGNAEQISQEFRLASGFDGPANYLFGAYYFDYESQNDFDITHTSLAFLQQALGLSSDFESVITQTPIADTTSYAFFGEGYFELNNKTNLTVGLRYSDDEKSTATRQIFSVFSPTGVLPEFQTAERSWGVGTGRITLDHKISEGSLLYGSLSRGYKAGGLNPGGVDGSDSFDPEYLNAIEFGLKGRYLGGRLATNISAFYYDYTDIQLAQGNSTTVLTVNADSEVAGLEFDVNYLIGDNWRVDLGVSLLDTEITRFQSGDSSDPLALASSATPALDAAGNVLREAPSPTAPFGIVIQDLAGNRLPYAAETSIKFGLQREFSFANDIKFTARLDHFWRDDFTASIYNKPVSEIEAWGQTNLQFRVAPNNEDWFVNLYVKNLGDNDDVVRIIQESPLVGRYRSVAVLEPRSVAIEFGRHFE